MVETLEQLRRCFPQSYINFDQEFIAHRRGGGACSLRGCDRPMELRCRVIEQLVRECCKTRPFKTAQANLQYRDYMAQGLGRFLGICLTEREWLAVYTALGNGVDRQLTMDWIASGYDLKVIRSRKQERLVLADRLLQTMAAMEYRARSLEQIRGGDDVLHRLMPKLIEQQISIRVSPVTRCEDCGHWTRSQEEPDRGYCLHYFCMKLENGYCDEAQRKEAQDGDQMEGCSDQRAAGSAAGREGDGEPAGADRSAGCHHPQDPHQ